MCDSSQEVIVRQHDCGTHEYITISKDESDLRNEKFEDLLFGRVLASDVSDAHGTVLLHKGSLLDKKNIALITDGEIDSVHVRSPLTCHISSGVCQQCFGMDLSTRKLVEIGNPVGIISSQSIGEPGTQLTMRTFHSESALVESDISQGIRRVEELFEIRKPKKSAVIAPFDGVIRINEDGKLMEIEIIGEPEPKPYIIKQ